MGLPLPLATCLSWVGPPSNLGGGECARCVPSSQSVSQMLLKCFFGIKTLTQRKLQPEGPIPGRKLVRKMTLCAT